MKISLLTKQLCVAAIGLLPLLAPAWDGPTDEASWNRLYSEVQSARTELDATIKKAQAAKLNTERANVSQVVLELFDTYIAWDRAHPEIVKTATKKAFWNIVRKQPDLYKKIPFDELEACLETARHATAELNKQLRSEWVLKAAPDFSKGTMKLDGTAYRLNERLVFPSKFVWMPVEERIMNAFGYLGGTYFTPAQIKEDGRLNSWYLSDRVNELKRDVAINRTPQQSMIGHVPARWMTEKYPEIKEGERWFIQYDIEHPQVETSLKKVIEQSTPEIVKAAEGQPMIHVLANEPHWAFREGGILMRPGAMKKLDVSEKVRDLYVDWLQKKYATVATLNQVYGTQYSEFNDARNHFRAPLDGLQLQGTAMWYDLCRFNMDRANDWFIFLKNEVHKYDPEKSPTSIKLLGHHLETGWRDYGIDLEFLVKMQEMPGADNQLVPLNTTRFRREYEDWQEHYMLDWREQSITLDFAKSICPNKPFYDSEWHGLSGGGWACRKLDRGYVRTALWLGFSQGLSAINTWVWGRKEDGEMLSKAWPVGEVLSQPVALDEHGRTLKELNAHAEIVHALVPKKRNYVVYYCEEAAIQDHTYPGQMATVYEALKLLNVPVGFTTPTEIKNISPSDQTLVVPPTSFISDASLTQLRAFTARGGNVVFVEGATSNFTKNELGQDRTEDSTVKSFASVPFDTVMSMCATLEEALEPVKPKPLVNIRITDLSGTKAYGVLASQSRDPESGEPVTLLINLSQHDRKVTLGTSKNCFNLLTGQTIAPKLTMKPYDIQLLKIAQPKIYDIFPALWNSLKRLK